MTEMKPIIRERKRNISREQAGDASSKLIHYIYKRTFDIYTILDHASSPLLTQCGQKGQWISLTDLHIAKFLLTLHPYNLESKF